MIPFGMTLDTAIAWLKNEWVIASKILAPLAPLLAMALALAHCSDKRHTRQRDKARAQVVQMEQASAANAAAQRAQIDAMRAKLDTAAKDNAHVETQIRTVYRDRAGTYADRMRFDALCRSQAPAPAQDQPAPVDHGPGPDAVVLARSDFETLVGNTARLEAVHQWGESLIADGTAVAMPEVGFGAQPPN